MTSASDDDFGDFELGADVREKLLELGRAQEEKRREDIKTANSTAARFEARRQAQEYTSFMVTATLSGPNSTPAMLPAPCRWWATGFRNNLPSSEYNLRPRTNFPDSGLEVELKLLVRASTRISSNALTIWLRQWWPTLYRIDSIEMVPNEWIPSSLPRAAEQGMDTWVERVFNGEASPAARYPSDDEELAEMNRREEMIRRDQRERYERRLMGEARLMMPDPADFIRLVNDAKTPEKK